MRTDRIVCSLLLASAAAVAMTSSAYSFTLLDNYIGGTDGATPPDIIGTSPPFSITSAVITRSGVGNSILNITINTNFAGAPGTGPADGTGYGSLFLNPLTWSGSSPGLTDNWVAGNRGWAYAVTNTSGNANISGQAFGMYAIGAVGSATLYPSTLVPEYYTTAGGKVFMSYTGGNGNPLGSGATPVSGSNGFTWRQGQAVQFLPNGTTPDYAATMTVNGTTSITYQITDNDKLGNTFALAWAMTCANDAIQGLVTLTNTDLQGTPLPAALPLFAGGLGFIGLLAGRRKRKTAATAAA
jgi:hypothetical protein